MKKYLTGIVAFIIAIAGVAFTKPAKPLTNVTFEYVPPMLNDYSQASVQNRANWEASSESCSDVNDKACTLQVPFTKTTSGGTQLGSSVTITSAQGSVSGEYYVTGGNNVSDIHNQD